MTRTLIARGVLLALLLAPPGAAAAPQRAAPLLKQDSDTVAQVQAYLNSINTLQSKFLQNADNGATATGTIYLERPGHMRIVYDKPNPILMVATGGEIYYFDPKLSQLSQIDVKDTPAWFLLSDNVHLDGDVTVTGFEHGPNSIRLTMVETKDPDRGRLTVVLSEHPLQLQKWTVVDPQNKTVTVTLDDPHYGVSLAKNLFIWTDPRATEKREPGG
jgi:outer membrane lipoprotein-sorting protein